MRFSTYIGIDYSGAGKPSTRTSSIQVYAADNGKDPQGVASPKSTPKAKRNWNRIEVHRWLHEYLHGRDRTIVGIDHGFSFPRSYFERYQLSDWDHFLADFVMAWPTHTDDATVEQFRESLNRNGDSKELRLTERWTSSAKSVFHFDVQGSVAKSTHAGLPFLWKLRKELPQLHFWPFDGFNVPDGRSAIAEVYPSLFRNRYPRANRTVDQQDAYSVCRWLKEMDTVFGLGRYFSPPITEPQKSVAALEGWILGIT